jgi:molecular chaperone GrpE
MPHHGNEEEHSSSRDQGSKRDEPVIRDHRKVDPVTGQARHPEGGTTAEPAMDAADSDGDALAQAEEILNRVEVPA